LKIKEIMPATIYTEDKSQQVNDIEKFMEDYRLIKAAGGVVRDDDARVLLIFRKGKWDLPKGKVEDDEPLELCAMREVLEETGLNDLTLRTPLAVTYHTYTEKGKDMLKETHWFLFDAPGKQLLKPQADEGISKVEWVKREDLEDHTNNTYQMIKDVLGAAGY
jgi:8-oxo-dGTP pyrophosphatase MutT (NUDIX family)